MKKSSPRQQETYLGIRGLDEVAEAVRKCYASLWGTRAVIYRNNLGFDQIDVALAVVIQALILALILAYPAVRDIRRQ